MLGKLFVFAFLLLSDIIVLRAQTAPPTVIPGEIPAPVLETEKTKPDTFTAGLTLSSDFDDNALNDNLHKQNNVLTVIAPNVGWTLFRTRFNWTLDYQQGLSMSQPETVYNSRSYVLSTALEFRMSKRLALRAREGFLESNNPFDRLLGSQIASGTTVVDRPNNSILTPEQTSSEQAGLDLTYALGRHSTITASGSLFNVSRTALSGTEGLGSISSTSGHLSYSHQMSPRRWAGVDYGVQRLISRAPWSHALVESVFYTETRMFTSNSMLSVFAGPERTFTRDEFSRFPPAGSTAESRLSWNWAGGATYCWKDAHSNLIGSFSRRISNGEGLFGIVRTSNLSTQYRHQIARGWKAELLASYDHERTIGLMPAGLSYVSAAGGVTRTLTRALSLEIRYWRIHEFLDGTGSGTLLSDHNRMSVSLTYTLNEPIRK